MIAYLNNKKIRKVDFHKSSGLDFSEIGYEGTPEYLQEDFDYAKQIYDNWDASITDRKNAFTEDKKLGHFPLVDTSNVTTMQDMFAKSSLKYIPVLDTSNVTNMQYTFGACTNLTSLDFSGWRTSNVTNMMYMFSGCTNLTYLDLSHFDTSNVKTMVWMFSQCSSLTSLDLSNFNFSNLEKDSTYAPLSNFLLNSSNLEYVIFPELPTAPKSGKMQNAFQNCSKLKHIYLNGFDSKNIDNMNSIFSGCNNLLKVHGYLDVSNISAQGAYSWLFGYSSNSSLRYCIFRNMGINDSQNAMNFSRATVLGVNSDEVPDARQSLIDSLITYSFDRATAGYSNCTITLSGNSKAVLTEDEIAQITSKGFTIA